jgi:predicted DNA-binding WGR domain protein
MELRNTSAGHSKFWKAELGLKVVRCSWGRIGTSGQSKDFTFASQMAAQCHFDSKVSEKLGHGYTVHRTGGSDPDGGGGWSTNYTSAPPTYFSNPVQNPIPVARAATPARLESAKPKPSQQPDPFFSSERKIDL